jgi:hypothetical protein
MTWLTWRQHRWEAAISGLFLSLLAAVLIRSRLQLQGIVDQFQVNGCPGRISIGSGNSIAMPSCQTLTAQFNQHRTSATIFLLLTVLVVPALVGMFVGAPLLAREFEHGTHRLVWTQGITRLRWLSTKLALLCGSLLLGGGILAVLGAWYRATADANTTPFLGFDVQGPALVAYAMFGLALATAAGALIRRTLPAMLVTLVGFAAARIFVASWLRPRFLPPLIEDATRTTAFSRHWYLQFNRGYVDAQGHALGPSQVNDLFRACLGDPQNPSSKAQIAQCVRDHGISLYNVYQPADRFWIFQSIEAAIFLALALALIGMAIWWVRRQPA